jgi:hypothetical protein
MYRRTFQDQDEGSFLLDILKIFIGVFLGSLAAVFTYEAIVEWRVEQAAKKAASELQRQLNKTNADMERQRKAQEQARARAEEEVARRRSALALADRLEKERKVRKETAWGQFYKPSPSCQVDSGTHACANEYMAARKRFEASYVDR